MEYVVFGQIFLDYGRQQFWMTLFHLRRNNQHFLEVTIRENWQYQLEKAWAKVFVSQGNIVNGDSRECITSITGGPTWYISTDDKLFNEKLKQLIFSNKIECAGTYNEQKDYEKEELKPNHNDLVLNLKNIILPDKSDVQLIKLKNPYGNNMEWKEEWSDYNSLWTQKLKQCFKKLRRYSSSQSLSSDSFDFAS